jgi:hypothetical protein
MIMGTTENSDPRGIARNFYENENSREIATALISEYRENSLSLTADQPVSCSGTLRPWDEVQRGAIIAEIQFAHAYYTDPRNPEGTLEQRRAALDRAVQQTFSNFVEARCKEYSSVSCHYRGIDWNKPGGSSWKTLTCQPGFQFVRGSLNHTQNGDWKAGPVWGNDDTQMSWRTGGHSRSETFAELDAVFANIPQRVLEELNSARAILHDRGIPTTWREG